MRKWRIANVHAVFTHIAEKMLGYEKRLGEYPTLSAIPSWVQLPLRVPALAFRNLLEVVLDPFQDRSPQYE